MKFISYTGTVCFNHRNGCQKCVVEGEYSKEYHTMSFENLNAIRRTDAMFRNREQPSHHKMRSILEELNIDMIKSFSVADSLHLLELGTD